MPLGLFAAHIPFPLLCLGSPGSGLPVFELDLTLRLISKGISIFFTAVF